VETQTNVKKKENPIERSKTPDRELKRKAGKGIKKSGKKRAGCLKVKNRLAADPALRKSPGQGGKHLKEIKKNKVSSKKKLAWVRGVHISGVEA